MKDISPYYANGYMLVSQKSNGFTLEFLQFYSLFFNSERTQNTISRTDHRAF